MELPRHEECQWIKCTNAPTTHVIFAGRVFAASDPAAPDFVPPIPDRRYLCDKHTQHVIRNYVDVTTTDIAHVNEEELIR
jgi:hypothetical protein